MGGSKNYISDGGFSKYEYNQIGTTENGIKIINNPKSSNTNTPLFSNTPYTAYAKLNKEGTDVEQVSVYGDIDGRQKIKDIDIGHQHKNTVKRNRKKVVLKQYSRHEIHVHEYRDERRSSIARKPSKKERRLLMIARYGKRK
ncbi:MAG: hypothetical protein IJ264_05750 [Clostridia bacterium]|nr:hypothetical protein [Clostridia bacterium]